MIGELNKRFGSEEAMGVRFKREDGTILTPSEMDLLSKEEAKNGNYESFFLRSGLDAVTCTNYATEVFLEYPDRTIIVGYSNDRNPNARTAIHGLHPGGHDFALVDSRYLVDPWIKFIAQEGDQIVFDLADNKQRIEVEVWYGKIENWEVATVAMEFARQLLLKI